MVENNLNNQDSFSNFGKNFQENLVTLIIKDRSFADQIREVLEISFFEHKYLQVFTKKIFDYKDKYKNHPSNDTIKTILKTELGQENEKVQEEVKKLFVKIVSQDIVENEDFIKDQSLQFCKKQVLKKAMIESIDLLHKASFDEIHTLINDALKKGISNDVGHDFILDFESRYQIKMRNPISTGIETIDRLMKGGPGKGDLCIIMAPSGAGKSFFLVWMGAQALKNGKNVVHYTMELSDLHTGNRYDSCLTGVSLNDLHSYKDQIYEKIKEVSGKLIIKEYPTKSISVRGIKNHLEKIKQRGIPIDLIIVDYLDILKSSSSYKDKRYELESITEELRAIGQYYGVPLWTATQTNRGGTNEEIIDLTSISEAYSKVFPADFIMTLSRTKNDKVTNTGRIFVAKNRNGPDSLIFPIFFDPSTVNIKILSENQPTLKTKEEESFERTFQNEEKLKSKYKQFKKLSE
jgi:replicative DNA helicase